MPKNVRLRNVQISYDVFLSNFRPCLPYDGILTFSANPSPILTFSTYPLPQYTVNRARGIVNKAFSATIKVI